MNKYETLTRNIPWTSLGRQTVASNIGLSLVPIGVLPFEPQKLTDTTPVISNQDEDFEEYLMAITGTAIQGGKGKLVTCLHVIAETFKNNSRGFILSRIVQSGVMKVLPYPIGEVLKYVDPRSNAVNPSVDIAVLLLVPRSTEQFRYEVPVVEWGDSTQLGVGDVVMVGGYPLGTEMFTLIESNRGIIQPTFLSGIISAILPATKDTETRMLQISISGCGGISGGAVFDPVTGKVLGMVTAGIASEDQTPLPITYAIPSEVIAPYLEVITFNVK